jgi:hypothetical protein
LPRSRARTCSDRTSADAAVPTSRFDRTITATEVPRGNGLAIAVVSRQETPFLCRRQLYAGVAQAQRLGDDLLNEARVVQSRANSQRVAE